MSKPPIGLGTGASTRPSRASRRDDAARVVAENPEPARVSDSRGIPTGPAAISPSPAAASPSPAPASSPSPAPAAVSSAAVTDLFETRKKPGKKQLNTYVTAATAARLDKFVRENGLKTTDVADKALSRLLDEMGVPAADVNGNLIEH